MLTASAAPLSLFDECLNFEFVYNTHIEHGLDLYTFEHDFYKHDFCYIMQTVDICKDIAFNIGIRKPEPQSELETWSAVIDCLLSNAYHLQWYCEGWGFVHMVLISAARQHTKSSHEPHVIVRRTLFSSSRDYRCLKMYPFRSAWFRRAELR